MKTALNEHKTECMVVIKEKGLVKCELWSSTIQLNKHKVLDILGLFLLMMEDVLKLGQESLRAKPVSLISIKS